MKAIIRVLSISILFFSGNIFGQAVTFNYTGAAQTYTVPACVHSLNVDLKAASGGGSQGQATGLGGKGGRVSATISVVPGEVLNIFVGQAGAISTASGTAGWNGGGIGGSGAGDGGGASDIRRGGLALSNRIVVAGAGGGAALCSTCTGKITGGDGGDTVGANGFYVNQDAPAVGKGGNQSEGGMGGTEQNPGSAGASGIGGNGGGNYGGGGGAGYFGGGGGATNVCCWGGGGGGGSSYVFKDAINIVHKRGDNTGNGIVIFTPDPAGPFVPGKIMGLDTICNNGLSNFSVDSDISVTSYTWVENPAFVVIAGQGTASVQIQSNTTDTLGSIGVIANNACGSSDTTIKSFVFKVCEDTIPDGINFHKKSFQKLIIYPNPNNGMFYVDVKSIFKDLDIKPKQIEISVTDLSGRILFETMWQLNGGEGLRKIDLSQLSKGYYFLIGKISNEKDIKILNQGVQLIK